MALERTGMAEYLLEIRDLHARVEGEDTDILRGVNLAIRHGEMHALMGPNGSGKSTLAKAIAGHPGYEVTGGDVLLEGESVLEMEPDERSRAGLFLAFQYPAEIPGVSISNFLRTAAVARLEEGEEMDVFAFQRRLMDKLEMLRVDPAFAARYVNDGFSGGEKKRNEILQLAMLEPKMAVMDETDSGLDIDALRIVSEGVNTIRDTDGGMGVLLITHYKRILNYLRPDHVHVMLNGQIAHSGGPELADRLEEMGYDSLHEEPEAATVG
jgi:Fe-S cluster assembly ATP-binding protein